MIRAAIMLPDKTIIELPPLISATLAQTISFTNNGKLTKAERKFVWNCLGRTGTVPHKMTFIVRREDVERHFPVMEPPK